MRNCGPGEYEQGSTPTVRATFETIPEPGETEGVPFDPSSLTVTVRSPSNVITTYTDADPEVDNPEVGVWEFTFPSPLTQTGKWAVTFTGGGATRSTWFTIVKAAVNV